LPAMQMIHDTDPADDIRKKVGDLSKIEVFGNRILLGVYERPERTKGGLYLSDKTREEDKFQGKAALVLKKGPAAFVSDADYDFNGQTVEVGDWVTLFVSDGRKVVVNGQLCRIVEDQHIQLKIPAPDTVY